MMIVCIISRWILCNHHAYLPANNYYLSSQYCGLGWIPVRSVTSIYHILDNRVSGNFLWQRFLFLTKWTIAITVEVSHTWVSSCSAVYWWCQTVNKLVNLLAPLVTRSLVGMRKLCRNNFENNRRVKNNSRIIGENTQTKAILFLKNCKNAKNWPNNMANVDAADLETWNQTLL